jgi:hypothetical protein
MKEGSMNEKEKREKGEMKEIEVLLLFIYKR